MKVAFDWERKVVDPDFCQWAFGRTACEAVFQDCLDLLYAWNTLHGDRFTISEEGNMFDDLQEMERLWNVENTTNDQSE